MTAALAAISLLLLVLSGALAAALAAVLRISESEARILAREGFVGAKSLLVLRASDVSTTPLSVLRTACSLGTVAAGVGACVTVWGAEELLWTLPAVVALALVAGDLVPRGLASRKPVRLALVAAPLLERGSGLFAWLLLPLRLVERLLLRTGDQTEGSAEQLQVKEALEIGADEGVVGDDEHRLVERAFQLDELDAWDAMTPRVDIFAWQASRTLAEIIPELAAVPHSRVPVYGDSIDDVTGILHVREAYQAYVAGQRDTPLSELAREPMFVPGSLSLAKLLAEFRARRVHMGIVADEFGGTDGLITLEDVLEELVGEIVDETDVDEEPLTRVSSEEIAASGNAELRELNQRFGLALPAGENRSLNGFILEELGHVPEPGTSFDAEGTTIEIVEASDTQVLRARLRRAPATDKRG